MVNPKLGDDGGNLPSYLAGVGALPREVKSLWFSSNEERKFGNFLALNTPVCSPRGAQRGRCSCHCC